MTAGFSLSKYIVEVKSTQSFDGFSGDGTIKTNVYCFVYDTGTKTLSTIYSDMLQTAKTNPISRAQFTTDGCLVFYAPSGNTYDVFLADEKGNTAFHEGVTANSHTMRLEKAHPWKHLVIPFAFSGAVEVDTGIDLPFNAHVMPPIIEVVTVESSKTINVGILSSGTGGSAAGFINGVSVATAGFVMPYTTLVGSTITYVNNTKVGTLIGAGVAGTDTTGGWGLACGYGYVTKAANTPRVTYTTSSGSVACAGYIHIPFRHLR